MSDLLNNSISSGKETTNNETSIYTSTMRKKKIILSEFANPLFDVNDASEKTYNGVLNNLKPNTENNLKTVLVKVKINNNKHFVDNKQEELTKIEENREQRKTRIVKLKLIIPNDVMEKKSVNSFNILNDISKDSSLQERNSTTNREEILKNSQMECPKLAIHPHHFIQQNKPKHRAPIMGTNVLLAKTNKENSISAVIHDLVIQRYNDILNRYMERNMHRRSSKIDSEKLPKGNNGSSHCLDRYYIPLPNTSIFTNEAATNHSDQLFNFTRDRRNVNDNSTESKLSGILSLSTSTFEESYKEEESENELKDEKCHTENNGNRNSFNKSKTNEEKNDEVEYDVRKFLEDALGDELEYASVDFQSQDKNCESCGNDKYQIDESSIGTADMSALVSQASTFHAYKPTKKNLSFNRSSTKMPPMFIEEYTNIAENENNDYFPNANPEVETLMKQILIQNEMIFQTSKALSFCKSAKEFVTGAEHIEAERILLVALCTKEALNRELDRMEYETPIGDYSASSGTVTISNLKFPMKQEIIPVEVKSARDFTENFVCIIRSGRNILASDVMTADKNGFVNINKSFTFVSLPADFEIDVCIYCMRVKNKLRTYSHESKFHLNKNIQNMCPSPKKLFHINGEAGSYKVTNELSSIMPSSFRLWGKYSINVHDLPRKVNFKMHNTPLTSTLLGTFTANITSKVELHNKMRGFLTIASENGGCVLWDRRWCVLEGSVFSYWNYPSEEENSAEPVGQLNLRHCTDNVSVADRNKCARPRSLLLYIGSENGNQKNYLLSADSIRELKEWEKQFNMVIKTLKNWKTINLSQ